MPVATSEYIYPGFLEAYFCPSIAALATPTVAEVVTAGTRLTTVNGGLLPDGLQGFSFKTQWVKKRIMADAIELNVAGPDQLADSTLVFNRFPGTPETGKKTALAKAANGFLCIFGQGIPGTLPASGDKCDIWPGVSAGPNDTFTGGLTELARWEVGWGASARPTKNVALT